MDYWIFHYYPCGGSSICQEPGRFAIRGKTIPLVWKQGNALEQTAPKSSAGDAKSSSAGNVCHPCRGNDLVNIRQAKMMKRITKDIKYIHLFFLSSYLVWSDILPRSKWLGLRPTGKNISKMDIKSRRINRHGRQVVHQYDLGRSISHELDVDVPGFFKNDGTHLTVVGNSIFFISASRRDKIFLQQ